MYAAPTAPDPARTYALVVAVSQYGYGDSAWDRDALDQDAVRFADWLYSRGVPKSNVIIVKGPEATAERIHEALVREVPMWNGDLLWIYWAGHGVIDGREELRLLLAGAPATDRRNLRLKDLRELYQSPYLPGFAQQIFIIDACQQEADYLGVAVSGPLDLPSPLPSNGRTITQVVWVATQLRDPAAYGPQGGLFSAAVRSSLNRAVGFDWRPTSEELQQAIEAEASRLACDEPIRGVVQKPIRIKYEDTAGPRDDVVALVSQGPQVAPPLGQMTHRQHQVLTSALANHAQWMDPSRLAEAVWAVADWLGQNSIAEMGDPLQLAASLDAMTVPKRHLPPLVVFLEYLAVAATLSGRRRALRGLADEIAESAEVTGQLQRTRREAECHRPSQTVVLIKIEADPSVSDAYRISGFLFRRNTSLLVCHRAPGPPTAAANVATCTEQLIDRMGALLTGLTDDLISYEFLLEHTYMDVAVERWGVAPGTATPSECIGRRSPVLVRSLDRLKNPLINRVLPVWNRRWDAFQDPQHHIGGAACPAKLVGLVYTKGSQLADGVLGDDYAYFSRESPSLVDELGALSSLSCLLLSFPFAAGQDEGGERLLDQVLQSGIPVAVWWRVTGHSEIADESLLEVAIGDPRDLPKRVLALRKSDSSVGIALLWDPPDPFPERTALLAAPEQLRSSGA